MRLSKNNSTGFSLLELLVALSLFGIIVSLLYGGLNIALKSIATTDKHSLDINRLLSAQAFFRSKLPAARRVNPSSLDHNGVFIGHSNAIEFVSDLPQSITTGGLAFYRIELNTNRQQPALNIALENYPKHSNTPRVELQESESLTRINQLKLSYYGRKANEQGPQWYEQWTEKSHLPLLVKIQIDTPSKVHWPAQIIALRYAR